MSELQYNGHENKYLKKDCEELELDENFQEQFNKLQETLKEKVG